MENFSEVMTLLENITAKIDYPLALVDEKLEILWFNDKAKAFFKRKENLSKKLSDYTVGMRTARTIKAVHSGQTCEFGAKGRVNKRVVLFETVYCDKHMTFAIWVDADDSVRINHERTRIDEMVLQYHSKNAVQNIFAAIELMEYSQVFDGNENLQTALALIEKEAYKMYRMLSDARTIYKDEDPLYIDFMRKFDFSEYFADLINATKLTLAALDIKLMVNGIMPGVRYVNANSHNFAISFLKLLKSVTLLIEDGPKSARVAISEEDGNIMLRIIARGSRLKEFLSEEQLNKGTSERNINVRRHSCVFDYNIAKKMVYRNNMKLTTEFEGDVTTICMVIPATENPTGALRSQREQYLGNKFSTVNLVFGDVM